MKGENIAFREENQVLKKKIEILNRELSIALEGIKKLEEENQVLKEENQQLRPLVYPTSWGLNRLHSMASKKLGRKEYIVNYPALQGGA